MSDCTCTCCGHGVLELDDRLAAYDAGYQRGVLDGRVEHLNDVLDREALRQAADLLHGVVARTLALVTGPEWAALQGDAERPEVSR